MALQYFAILTDYGTGAIAQALSQGQPLQLTKFAVGDGNGQAVTPTASATALVHQTHIAPVSAVSLDPRNNKQVIVELTIPENVGGFYIREMGVFDAQNKLIAYANCPESFKPTESSGSGKVQVLRMILKVESSSAVTLSIDNSVIFVTRQQMAPKTITATTQNGFDESGHSHEIAKASTTQQGIVQLTNDTGLESESLALTAKAGKKLAQLIATVQLALNNYIPLNKRSSAVNSNDENNVATSKAVKTAYDKGVDAKNAADNANNNANTRVAKSGDTMTGSLNLNRADAVLIFQRNEVNKSVIGFRNVTSEDLLLYNYAFNTEFALRRHDLYCNKSLNLPGAVFENGDYAGFNIKNGSERYVRVEGNPDSNSMMMTFAYRDASGQNQRVVTIPKKNGEVLLNTDITSSLSNNGWCKLPNGLILQWGNITLPNLTNEQTGVCTLPVTFPSAVFSIIIGGVSGSISQDGNSQEGFSITQQTTSNFTWVSSWERRNKDAFNNAPAQWIAIGY